MCVPFKLKRQTTETCVCFQDHPLPQEPDLSRNVNQPTETEQSSQSKSVTHQPAYEFGTYEAEVSQNETP